MISCRLRTRWKLERQRGNSIAFELLNALGSFDVGKLTETVNHVYNSDDVPEEMLESIFIALLKETGRIECKSHRPISLMSHVTKIILRVELNRGKGTIRGNLLDEQFGD